MKLSTQFDELKKFNALSSEWWDPKGKLRLLHLMNPIRIDFLLRNATRNCSNSKVSFQGLNILDVGCGAGILTEPLARLGAHVTGLDAADENIKFANLHQTQDASLAHTHLKYKHGLLSELDRKSHYDIITAMEVIEHVDSPSEFVSDLVRLAKPEGYIALSTMNKTLLAHFLTITVAEQALHIVDPGTHDSSKYISPESLQELFSKLGWKGIFQGIRYHPIKGIWEYCDSLSVNYLALFHR